MIHFREDFEFGYVKDGQQRRLHKDSQHKRLWKLAKEQL